MSTEARGRHVSAGRRKTTARHDQRAWPKRALALTVFVLVAIYAIIFLAGDRTASPKLGIDLQGGTRVTLVPQGGEPTQEQLAQARTILENRVNGMGVSGAEVVTDGNTLVITVPGEDTSQARAVGQTSQLLFRPVAAPAMPDGAALPQAVGDMANRWVAAGILTPEQGNAQRQKLVEALQAGVPEGTPAPAVPPLTAVAPPEPKNSLEETAQRREAIRTMREDRQSTDPTTQLAAAALMVCDGSPDPLAGSDDPTKPLVTCDPSAGAPLALDPVPPLVGTEDQGDAAPRLTGDQIDTGRPITGGLNPETGQMEINFAFKSGGEEKGGSTWAKLTQDYLGKQVAITLDSQIISAPRIQSPTPAGSGTSITGEFTQQEAQDLANNLKYGALPLSFAGENGEPGGTAQTVPPSLGQASLQAGLVAGLVGLAMVAVFVFWYYRTLGFISLITLAVSAVLVYGALVLLGRWIGYSLDLAGVAGLIIGIGTTADSFVVVYERIKDEVRQGRTFRSATPRGWDRARKTIVTGNMVTVIAAIVIYFLAVGEVKGFAFTLGLTTVFDFFVTFFVTAPLLILASRKPLFAKPLHNGMGRAMEFAAAHGAEYRANEEAFAASATSNPGGKEEVN